MNNEEREKARNALNDYFVTKTECALYRKEYDERLAKGSNNFTLLSTQLQFLVETVGKIDRTVEAQKEQPKKRLDKLVDTIIGVGVGALIMYALTGSFG